MRRGSRSPTAVWLTTLERATETHHLAAVIDISEDQLEEKASGGIQTEGIDSRENHPVIYSPAGVLLCLRYRSRSQRGKRCSISETGDSILSTCTNIARCRVTRVIRDGGGILNDVEGCDIYRAPDPAGLIYIQEQNDVVYGVGTELQVIEGLEVPG